MTQSRNQASELARKFIETCRAARIPVEPCKSRLFRGESRAISGTAEDLPARVLLENMPNDRSAHINQPMTAGDVKLKPDLSLVRDRVILNLCEVNMDLGYKRKEFPDWLKGWDAKTSKCSGNRYLFALRKITAMQNNALI